MYTEIYSTEPKNLHVLPSRVALDIRVLPELLLPDERVRSIAEPVEDDDLSLRTLSLRRNLSLSPTDVVDPESDTSPGVPGPAIPAIGLRLVDTDPFLLRTPEPLPDI